MWILLLFKYKQLYGSWASKSFLKEQNKRKMLLLLLLLSSLSLSWLLVVVFCYCCLKSQGKQGRLFKVFNGFWGIPEFFVYITSYGGLEFLSSVVFKVGGFSAGKAQWPFGFLVSAIESTVLLHPVMAKPCFSERLAILCGALKRRPA